MAGWADVAQYVLALTGAAALGFVYLQVRTNRAAERRGRVYDYADAFNAVELLRASAEHKAKWPEWTVEDLKAMSEVEQAECMRLPNIIEEVAYLYNHKALDRNVAAELLGVYVECLWDASEGLIRELRVAEGRPQIFIDWEQMQGDTWRRRGLPGPVGPILAAATPSTAQAAPVSRAKWLLSAEYRRNHRKGPGSSSN
jgi:hypothetical protein